MMKQELIHSHILVAMLCGWEPQKPNKTYPNGHMRMRADEGDAVDEIVSNDAILDELPYGTDWNYLMAAYNEFRDIAEGQEDPENEEDLMKIRDSIIEAILDYNIDLAFKELVRGVDKVNQLKTQDA